IKRACRMRKVMLRKKKFDLTGIVGFYSGKFFLQETFEKHLFLQPYGDCCNKGVDTPGSEGVVCFKQSLKLEKRLIIEGNRVKLVERTASIVEAEPDCIGRETGVMLLTGKAFFLSSGNNFSVRNYCGGRVVVERRDS